MRVLLTEWEGLLWSLISMRLHRILLSGPTVRLCCQNLASTAFRTYTGVGVVLGSLPVRRKQMFFTSASITLRLGMCTRLPLLWSVQPQQQLSINIYIYINKDVCTCIFSIYIKVISINLTSWNCEEDSQFFEMPTRDFSLAFWSSYIYSKNSILPVSYLRHLVWKKVRTMARIVRRPWVSSTTLSWHFSC